MMKTNITDEEKFNMLLKFCEKNVGYKATHDFMDAALEKYDPISYAVKKAEETLEKR